MSALVEKLSSGQHPVIVVIRPACTPEALEKCLRAGYLNLKFPDTQGGTTLHMSIDPTETDLRAADFKAGTGHVDVMARLTLDYIPLRCKAQIDLSSMSGTGQLIADSFA